MVYLFAHVWLVITSAATVIVILPAQLSVAITKSVLAAGTSSAQLTVKGPGTVTIGGVLSNTVIV